MPLTISHPSGYRGRLAPSPTGNLHLGHAKTFWTAWLRARQRRGVLVLRNDDLDPQRSKPEYVQAMYEDLRWFGLEWDEGPDVGGPYAPYCQSQRREFYLEAWRKLYDGGALYACTCSRRELAQAADAPHEDDEPLYPGTCRGSRPSVDLPAGYNWRFRVPEGEVVRFLDGYHGEIEFVAERDFGDFLVWRRDDVPAYQLATVVDDAQMRITEVVRGADLLKSTARQLLLYYALDFPTPTFYHCPLVTDEHGVRLAKRHDSLSLRTLRQRGLQPENLRGACT